MRAGSAASRISETDLPVDRIRATKILHISGISQAISSSAADAAFAAIDIAHDAKRLVSYDPNLRLKLWPLRRARAIIHEAMRACDIALPGLDDAEALTGLRDPDAIASFYLDLGARVVVVKMGRGGALAATPKERERIYSHGVKAVDATGRGRLLRRRFPRGICAARRSVRRGALRQCGGGALDLGLWRGRAVAETRRRRSGDGGANAVTPFFPSPSLAAAYIVACLLLAATPGADMALFLSRTLAGGRAQGFAAQAGANVGLVVHTFAAALGLSALLAASAEAYEAVKIGGALYLLWLAWRAIRHGSVLKLTTDASARGGLRGAFANGLLINLTNPKIVLFFVTFLPQFISASDPHASMKLFVLGFGFIAITTLVNAIVVLVAGHFVAAAKRNPRALRIFDYGFAALMSAFAGRLIWSETR